MGRHHGFRMRTRSSTILPAIILAWATLCGCSTDRSTEPAAVSASVSKDKELLSNSASLLYNLLKDEKNLNKILFIKGHSKELGGLVDAISRAAADGGKQLEAMAQVDPMLNLDAAELPSGEQAARKAIAKTKEHELLFSSGDNFAFNLLVTQADALSYGSHLAEIVSENAPPGDFARQFHSLASTLDGLLRQVASQMRSLPQKSA
jgi:hypothetical protein